MALLNYEQKSFFKEVFDPVKDFSWKMPYEIPEELQKEYDPVGFWYFHKRNVRPILQELRHINVRISMRDLLREMDRIWRFNNQQHRIINEPDWTNKKDVADRVDQLTRLTRRRLSLQQRASNQVSSDTIRTWEYQEPMPHPVYPKGTLSGQVLLQHPRIMDRENPPLFANVTAFDKRIFIPSALGDRRG